MTFALHLTRPDAGQRDYDNRNPDRDRPVSVVDHRPDENDRMYGRNSALIPMPVSVTETQTSEFRCSIFTLTSPASVNLAALLEKFQKICKHRDRPSPGWPGTRIICKFICLASMPAARIEAASIMLTVRPHANRSDFAADYSRHVKQSWIDVTGHAFRRRFQGAGQLRFVELALTDDVTPAENCRQRRAEFVRKGG